MGESLENAFETIKRDIGLMLTTAPFSSEEDGNTVEKVKSPMLQKSRIELDSADTSAVLNRMKALLVSSAPKCPSDDESYSSGRKNSQTVTGRKEWQTIEKELQHVQGLASWTVQNTPSSFQSQLLSNLKDSIKEASHFLIQGTAPLRKTELQEQGVQFPSWFTKGEKTRLVSKPPNSCRDRSLHVWVSPQDARCAIIKEAISLAIKTENPLSTAHIVPNPLVIVVLEHENTPTPSQEQAELTNESIEETEGEAFLSAWTRACYGLARVVTVVVDSSSQLRMALEQTLRKASSNSSLPPVLVNLYASCDSVITSSLSSLRHLCDMHNTRLCVEGPGLALIAQPECPSDPYECAEYAHVLMLDPGSWFGFKMCAALSRHDRKDVHGKNSVAAGRKNPPSECLFAGIDDNHGLSIVPLLNLWTVMSRIGLQRMRSMVDEATALSEKLVVCFAESINIKTTYDGIGCIVRMSFAMSKEDRMRKKYKARSHVERANKAIYAHLEDNARDAMVYLHTVGNCTFLQFSPARLLRSGSLWIPSEATMVLFAKNLQHTVDTYETCIISAASFASKLSKCQDIEIVGDAISAEGRKLCFGAFRVVPHEFRDIWESNHSLRTVVLQLSRSVMSEVQVEAANSSSFIGRSASRSKRVNSGNTGKGNKSGRGGSEKRSKQHKVDIHLQHERFADNSEIPFVFRLNNSREDSFPDYISIEPKSPTNAPRAVRHAELAAQIVLSSVSRIIGRWRSGNQIPPIPINLANISGRELNHSKSRGKRKNGFLENMRNMACSGEGWGKYSMDATSDAKKDHDSLGTVLPSYDSDLQEIDDDEFFSADSCEGASTFGLPSPVSSLREKSTEAAPVNGKSNYARRPVRSHSVKFSARDISREKTSESSGRSKTNSPSGVYRTSSRGLNNKRSSPDKDVGWFGRWSSSRNENQSAEDSTSGRKHDNHWSNNDDREHETSTMSGSNGASDGSTSSIYTEDSGGQGEEIYDSEEESESSNESSEESAGSEGSGELTSASSSTSVESAQSLALRKSKRRSQSGKLESEQRAGWLSRWINGNTNVTATIHNGTARKVESEVDSCFDESDEIYAGNASRYVQKSAKRAQVSNDQSRQRSEELENSEDDASVDAAMIGNRGYGARAGGNVHAGASTLRPQYVEPAGEGVFGYWFGRNATGMQPSPVSNEYAVGREQFSRYRGDSNSSSGSSDGGSDCSQSSSDDDRRERRGYNWRERDRSGHRSHSRSRNGSSDSSSGEYESGSDEYESGSDEHESRGGSGIYPSGRPRIMESDTESDENDDADLRRRYYRDRPAQGLLQGYGRWFSATQTPVVRHRNADRVRFVDTSAERNGRRETYGYFNDDSVRGDGRRTDVAVRNARDGGSQSAWWGFGTGSTQGSRRHRGRPSYR